MRNWFAVIGFVFVALIVGVCTACSDPDDQADAWAPATADNRDDNRNGDCRNTHAECSDDDQLAVIVCVEPDSCRFG